jgi:peroxiredoxin
VEYDNGRSVSNPIAIATNGHLAIIDTFYSRKAVIYIYMKDSSTNLSNGYFVDEAPAKFVFDSIDLPNKKPVFTTINANAISEMGEKQLKDFTAKEEADASLFFRENGNKLGSDSMLSLEANKRILAVTNKRLAFIARNSNQYYSFWFFRKNIIGNLLLDADTLMNFYRKTFPGYFQKSDEGDQITTFLNGRLISSSHHSMAPDFTSRDIRDEKIILKNYRGKYVLLSFWATWCLPCVAELPAMREIRKSTTDQKLEMISISFDKDLQTLQQYLKTHEMNWVNIYYDEKMSKQYGVSSLPRLFLIDDQGRVVYDRKTDEKQYTSLSILKKIIEDAKLN